MLATENHGQAKWGAWRRALRLSYNSPNLPHVRLSLPQVALMTHSKTSRFLTQFHCQCTSTSVQLSTVIWGTNGRGQGKSGNWENFSRHSHSSEMKPPQIRKTMPSDTMTWLSSCILLRADSISAEEKGSSLSLLMDSVSRFMPTDCAWASRNTSKRAALNAFNLARTGKSRQRYLNDFRQDLYWGKSKMLTQQRCPPIHRHTYLHLPQMIESFKLNSR